MHKGLAKTNCLYSIGGLLLIGAFLALSTLFLPKPAHASTGVNQTINFQGRLLNNQGATVPDGFYNIEFKIYQDGDGQSVGDTTGSPAGSLKWTEDWLNSASHGVKVVNGYLSVQLGSITAFGSNIDWNQNTLWLSMQIGDTSSCTITTTFQSNCGGDGEMTPMQPMTSAPYALNSGELGGLTGSQYVQLAQGVQVDSSTNVSVGINKTGTSGSILELQKSTVDVMNVSNTGTVLFQPSADSTTALQVENHANSYAVFTVDTSNNQVILGKANSLNGKLAFATTGGGLITLNPTATGSNFTITVPAENGTLCTTAASAACAAVYATTTGTVLLGPSSVQADSSNNNSIYINKTSGTGNILELQKSASDVFKIDNSGNVTSTGQNTLSRTGSGSNDYTLGVTSTPAASGTSSLVRIGGALTSGNGVLNGGTYLSIVEPSSGAGSAADFFNLQNGSTVEMQLASNGNLTVGGTYNGNTFDNAGHLTFGNSGAATISSNGSNNLTVDTGSSGGTESLGNNAATTNIGSSNAAHAINIGTGNGGTTTQAVTIGEATNSSSTLTLQGGNGAGSISLLTGNNGTTAGSIQIGNTSGAFNQTISIGNNNSASNTVNIGTGTGQDSVTIGDTTSANSAVNIKAGSTGGITLGANTNVSANSNLSLASGSGKFDASNATGTFDTTTGANHLNGNTTVTGTNTFTVNGGATTLNGASAGSGTAATVNTNAASNTGLVIQGVSSQTAALLQLQDSTGAALINADASGNIDELGNFNTPYAGIGNYGNLLIQSEQLGTSWTATNINVTQNDGASNPAPDGNTTADKLVSTASGTHTLTQTYSSAGNHTYTFSIWLKSANPPRPVQLRIDSNGTPGTGTPVSFNVLGNWQRYSVTQTFTSGVTSVTPTLVITNNNADIVGWGAQLVQGSSEGVYTRTGASTVASGSGLLDNQTAVFQALNNSATAYQFQNSSGVNVAAIDTSNGQLVLGTAGASGVSGQVAFNYAGQTGNITLQVANPGSSNYTITLPAEDGQICTTAASAACTAVYAPAGGSTGYVILGPSSVQADSSNNNSIYINKTSGTGNILELQKSASDVFKIDNSGNLNSTGNVSNSGQNTLSRNSSGSNDYSLGVTGTPSATGSSSLVRIGNALTGGNGALNGGTYLSIVEPAAIGATAGSAADFVNFQNGSTVELQLASNGNLTVGGTYNGNTFDNAGHLTFGNSGAAVISSNGSNNLTVDTGSSGGTESLGNNAATTNIGSSNAAHTINIGTGSGGTTTQAVTIGEATNSSSTLTLQGGNGTGAISLLTGNNGTSAGTIQIGNTSGAFNQTISIGNNNAAANAVNIGTGTGQDAVTIGDTTTASSSVTLKAGSTGGITLGANTNVSANSNVIFGSGSGKFDASNATGTFDTSTGTNHLNGNTTVTNSNTFTVNGGATTLNGPTAGSSSAAKINTNAASNTGLVIQGASSQSAALLQLQDSTNANLLTVDPSGNLEMLGYQDTPFGGFGTYSNLLLYSEQFDQSGTWAQSNITSVTGNDGPSNPAPDSTTTADKITASASGTHSLTQAYTTATNGNYTFSVWVKTNSSSTGVQLRIDSTGATPTTGTAASFTATTTWQRFSVTQNFTGTPSNIKAVLLISSNNAVIAAWGGQLVAGTTAGVYVRTVSTNTVAAGDGLISNGQSIFMDNVNSTTAYQFQNNSAVNVAAIDTTNGQLVLGTAGASGLSGQIKFNYAGQSGSVALQVANPSSTGYTITLPAENGTICTTAASAACTAVYAPAGGGYVNFAPSTVQTDSSNNNSIYTNKTSGTGNILELQKSASDVFKIDNSGNVTSTGQNTLSRNGTGSNDYTFGITGTPSATGSSSLIRIGSGLAGGNGVANGGTYLSIVEPGSGAGSAADFFNLQNGSTVELQLTATGDLTVNGKYDTNTFNNNTLSFGGNSAATISSNGTNNLTVDTGSSGGTEFLGNNAATTNIGSSNAAHTINIGTGSGGTTTQAVTIGEATNSSSTVTLQGGNGTGAISLITGNNGTSAGTIQIGNTSGAFNQSISIGNNSAAANTVNIGVGTGQDSVTIGDTTTASSAVNIKAGSSGGISLGANTTLSANSNLSFASGSGSFDAHNATGTFQTSSGNNSLNGNTTVTGTNSFTVNGGATTLNGPTAGGSSALKVNTNAATNTGLIVQGATSQSAVYLQLQDSTGAGLLTDDANGNQEQLGYLDSPYAGLGVYGNLLLYSEQFDQSGTWAQSNITSVTANDAASNPAPDGNTTADKIVSSASGTHSLTQTYTTTTNGNYTFSIWVKTNSSSTGVQLRIDSTGATPTTGTAASFTATTTWQRLSVSQNFTGTPSNIKAVLLITSNNSTIVAWGGQMVTGTVAGVYVRTTGGNVASNEGFISNGSAVFQAVNNSTTAFQVQNSSGANVLVVDTTDRQLRVMENNGSTNYALVYYDTATSTANYTASSGTVAVGTGAGAITVTAGSGAAVNITANAASTWKTTAGTLTLQSGSGTSDFLVLNAGGSGQVQVNGSAVVKLGQASADPTCTTGAIYYNTTTNLFRGCQNGAWATLSSTNQTLQGVYTASTGGTTPEIKLNTGGDTGGVDIQDADTSIAGVLFAVRGTNAGGLGTSMFNVSSANNTVNIGASGTSPALLVLGSDTDSTFNGGNTNLVASAQGEINGAMFYSSTDHNFLCGTAGQWITCNGLLYSNTAASSAVNTCTSACAAFSTNNAAMIPANYCQAGRVITIRARGHFSVTGTPTLQMGVYYGTNSTTAGSDVQIGALTPAPAAASGAPNQFWELDYTITCFDTSHMLGEGTYTFQTSSSSTSSLAVLNMLSTSSTSVTTTSAKSLYIFPTWSASSASNTVTLDQLVVTGN